MRNGTPLSLLEGGYWYEAPFLHCAGERLGSGPGCNSSIPLPYQNLPQTDHEQLWLQEISLLQWPSDEWQVFSACRGCGLVAIRGRAHLVSERVVKQSVSRFCNDLTLHCAEFPCADARCKAPTKMYLEIPNGEVGALLADLKGLKFHGTLPCGHAIKPIPSPLCKIHQVTQRLW